MSNPSSPVPTPDAYEGFPNGEEKFGVTKAFSISLNSPPEGVVYYYAISAGDQKSWEDMLFSNGQVMVDSLQSTNTIIIDHPLSTTLTYYVYVIAVETATGNHSGATGSVYTYTLYGTQFAMVSAPTAFPTGANETYLNGYSLTVMISCVTIGALFKYSFGNNAPYISPEDGTSIDFTGYNETKTLNIMAYSTGNGIESSVTSYYYTFAPAVPLPIASPTGAASLYQNSEVVPITISCSDNQAVIWYTLDGTNPSNDYEVSPTSIEYQGSAFNITGSGETIVLKIIAYNETDTSDINTYRYIFRTYNYLREGTGTRTYSNMFRANKKR